MNSIVNTFLRDFLEPVSAETQAILSNAKTKLEQEFHTGIQYIGVQYAGCGATIGVMPRCDFACRGCYLNDTANQTPRQAPEAIKQQLRTIRQWLGEGGNVQITDGEVTLLPIEELIEIIRYARKIGLVPMLMTHGDSFIKSPELLHTLVIEAGLTEVSIHIDTTQRGRQKRQYKYAKTEKSLNPLRDEFAELIRSVKQITGKPLEVATTVTVTQDNVGQIPDIVSWVCNNADVFKMASFQPLAQVGRTDAKLSGISTTEMLWNNIEMGLSREFDLNDPLINHLAHFGHPDCTSFIQGVVIKQDNHPTKFQTLFRSDDAQAVSLLKEFSHQIGGVSFRLGSRWQKVIRALGILVIHPKFILLSVVPFAWRNLSRLHSNGPFYLLLLMFLGKLKVNYMNIVSHHFMSREEIETPLGQERLNACVFKVPINGDMVSMCEVNALDIREKYYASLSSEKVKSKPISRN